MWHFPSPTSTLTLGCHLSGAGAEGECAYVNVLEAEVVKGARVLGQDVLWLRPWTKGRR